MPTLAPPRIHVGIAGRIESRFLIEGTSGATCFGLRPRPMVSSSTATRKAHLAGVALVTLSASIVGCGRPATVEDCEKIVARIAELELKEVAVSDQTEVKAQIQGAQTAFKERLMTDCVGRRLRQSSLDCLAKASSAEAAVKECF